MADNGLGMSLDEQRRQLLEKMMVAPPNIPMGNGAPMPNFPRESPLPQPTDDQKQDMGIPFPMRAEHSAPLTMPTPQQQQIPNLQLETPQSVGSRPYINPPMQSQQGADEQELRRLTVPGADPSNPNAYKSGASQIHNPFLRGLAKTADIVGSVVAPWAAVQVPGTSLHHDALVNRQEGLLNQDVKREQEQAQAGLLDAETDARLHPKPQVMNSNKGIVRVPQEGEATPVTMGGEQLDVPEKAFVPRYEKVGEDVIEISKGGDGKSVANVVYHGDPKRETLLINKEMPDGPHNVLVDKNSNEVLADYGRKGHEPSSSIINQGTWQMAEDDKGKPILYNSKSGETREAPGNLHPKGTYAKGPGMGEKALNYANTYMQSKTFTGPGDEALQEQFFSLAKPDSGFRMTQPQILQLQQSASWIEQAKAKGLHAAGGGWFSPEQRAQIVKTMNDLASAGGNPNAQTQPQGSGVSVHKVGDPVSIKGKPMKITAVHPDGSFDAE